MHNSVGALGNQTGRKRAQSLEPQPTCKERLANYRFSAASYLVIFFVLFQRFTYYGVNALITLYLKDYLGLKESIAIIIYHLYIAFQYLCPVIGGVISDNYWGRFKTIAVFTVVSLSGYIVMTFTSLEHNIPGPIIGMFIVSFGIGCITPCVSAFGGDQVATSKKACKIDAFFTLLYIAINVGGSVGTLITPILRGDIDCIDGRCYPLAFGVPTLLFIMIYIVFVSSKSVYVIKPTEGNVFTKFVKCYNHAVIRWFKEHKNLRKNELLDYADDEYTGDFIRDAKAVTSVILLFLPFPIFWAAYDQQQSTWTLQANRMNGYLTPRYSVKPEQMTLMNPILIIIIIPLFEMLIFPLLSKVNILHKRTSRILLGYAFVAITYIYAGFIQIAIEDGHNSIIPLGQSRLHIINLTPHSISVKDFSGLNLSVLIRSEKQETITESVSYPLDFTIFSHETKNSTASQIYSRSGDALSIFVMPDETVAGGIIIENALVQYDIEGIQTKLRIILGFSPPINSSIIAILKRKKKQTLIFKVATNDSRHISNYIDLNHGKYELQMTHPSWSKPIILGEIELTQTEIISIALVDQKLIVNDKDIFGEFKMHSLAPEISSFTDDVNDIVSARYNPSAVNYTLAQPRLIEFVEMEVHLVSMFYQIPMYVTMACAELFLSVTAMAFAYQEAPVSLKTVTQSAFLFTMFLGNILTAFMTLIRNGVAVYFIMVILVVIAAISNAILAIRFNKAKAKRTMYGEFLDDFVLNYMSNTSM